MRFLPVNSHAILVELDKLEQTMGLFNALENAGLRGVVEIIPAAKTVMIRFDPFETSAKKLAAALGKLKSVELEKQSSGSVTIPVIYDGEDLAWTAEYLGMEPQALIDWHTSQTWQVAFMGFAPGFGYLMPLGEDKLLIPRRKSPRKSIPAGAVALAGEFSGVYPQASPGGWQLIGQTPLKMWDPQRENPALLQPRALVKFEVAHADSTGVAPGSAHKTNAPTHVYSHASANTSGDSVADESKAGSKGLSGVGVEAKGRSISGAESQDRTAVESQELISATGESERSACGIKVLQTGLPVFFQDGGRSGLSRLAITASGAADKSAMWQSNRIVGNPRDTAVLEISQGNFRMQALQSIVVAVAGAECDLKLHTEDGRSSSYTTLKPIRLEAGDELHLGAVQRGYRNYLTVRGGFNVPEILGSSSYDSLAGLGPEPVQAGQYIPIRNISSNVKLDPVLTDAVAPFDLPKRDEVCVLDVTLGPRADWFTQKAINDFLTQEWEISATSNRIGLRFSAEKSLKRLNEQELASEATLAGAIQVPANGQPVLFHRDHPLTGGYPIIAYVCTYHLDLAAQLPPRSKIKFNCVGEFQEIST